MTNRSDLIAVLTNQWQPLRTIRASLVQEDRIVSQLLTALEWHGDIWKMTEITGHHLEIKYCLAHDVSGVIVPRRAGLPRCNRCLGILE